METTHLRTKIGFQSSTLENGKTENITDRELLHVSVALGVGHTVNNTSGNGKTAKSMDRDLPSWVGEMMAATENLEMGIISQDRECAGTDASTDNKKTPPIHPPVSPIEQLGVGRK